MPPPPALKVTEVSKTFGFTHALDRVSVSVAGGEIHALLGHNGSGKSTLVKILSGYHAPDPGGAVLIDGEPVALPITPAAMRRGGLAVVHQDLGLIDSHTVTENIRLGRLEARRLTRAIAWRRERERAAEALAALGARIDLSAKVGSLSVFERTEVAIARALQGRPAGRGLVVFDESTRALPPGPRAHLHRLSGQIAAGGGSVLLVSHRLEEVLLHADRVSAIRDGAVVIAGAPACELSQRELIVAMLGREPRSPSRRPFGRTAPARAERPSRAPGGVEAGRESVSVRGLEGRSLRGVGLSVAGGEVLGVTGLIGSGFEELPYLLAGAARARAGILTLGGRRYDLAGLSLRALLGAGVALVPERRDTDGLALSRSVAENVTLPRARARGGRLAIGREWQRREAGWVIETLGVRPAQPGLPVASLSGGNQQKVLIGKWLCARPRLLLAHEVTQGVDVGARAEIEDALLRAAAGGCAVILASMDACELAGLCDRVLVLEDGRIARELAGERGAEEIAAAVHGERARALA